MELAVLLAAFAAGYVASIFTWDRAHTFFIGVEAKAEAFRQQARDLEAKLRSAIGK